MKQEILQLRGNVESLKYQIQQLIDRSYSIVSLLATKSGGYSTYSTQPEGILVIVIPPTQEIMNSLLKIGDHIKNTDNESFVEIQDEAHLTSYKNLGNWKWA